jgi:FtsP/CotA-like multicopper oxidase with cupredoxin domain
VRQVLLPPGGRAEVVVDAAAAGTGRLRLTALPYSVNADGSGAGRSRTLLTLDLPSGPALPPLPSRLGEVPALEAATAARTRRIVLAADADGGFTVDGRSFDDRRTDLTACRDAGVVGDRQRALRRPPVPPAQPPRAGAGRGRATAVARGVARHGQRPRGSDRPAGRPADRCPGRTVYHCHVASHEDLGMMGMLDVRA